MLPSVFATEAFFAQSYSLLDTYLDNSPALHILSFELPDAERPFHVLGIYWPNNHAPFAAYCSFLIIEK